MLHVSVLNPLKTNDLKKHRTAQLTSRCCILYICIQQIYVLNILNMLQNLRFFLFKMLFISVKNSSTLPDDGSHTIRNML